MKIELSSPFQEGAKSHLTTREFKLWYADQWVFGLYYVYKCESTGREHRTEELAEPNMDKADEYLLKRKQPHIYD